MAWVAGAAEAGFDRRSYCAEGTDRNVEAGNALIHGLPHDRVFWSMPAGSAAAALMCRRTAPAAVLAAPAAGLLLSGLLVFGLGRLLAGGAAGALALALFAWGASPEQAFNDRWLFSLTLLLVAYLAVWRARCPSGRKTVLLAAATGLSLNVLSVLFLFPAALAAREKSLRRAAPLLLVPLLFLLPWALANRRVAGRLALLEAGRSDTNVITGALGRVRTVGPSYARAMVGLPHEESAAAWAAVEVVRHPLRYAAAVARRLLYAASLRPLLLAAALLALWLFRRRPGHAALGLLILYYLGVHCLMAVEERYFAPLWPLAAAAAASLAGLRREEPARSPWSALPAACALLPLAGLAAYGAGLTLAYPSRSADPGAWERELAREPGQAWLWGEAGRTSLQAGRPAEAVAALTRSLRLVPQREQERLLSWAKLIRGGPGSGLSESLPRAPEPEMEPDLRVRHHIMRAMAQLRRRREKAASEELSRAETLQTGQSASWGTRAAAATRDTLRSRTRELIAYWPIQDRLVILAGLHALSPEAPLWTSREEAQESLRRAAKAASRGAPAREDALRALGDAERLAGPDAGVVRLVAERYVTLAAPERAVETLSRLADRRPLDRGLRLDLAVLAHGAGRREAALRALDEARRLPARDEDTRRLADVYREIGEPRRAAALLTRMTAARTNANDLAGLARLHLSMREYGESLRLLDELVRREPGEAKWRNDRGVTLLLLGRPEEAAADLRLALAKDPGLLTAALSLGTLLSSTGRVPEARAVYDRALADGRAGDPAVRAKLLDERDALR